MKTGKKQGVTQRTNSTSWKPGECGNPNGRPKLDPVLAESRKILNDKFTEIVFGLAQLPFSKTDEISRASESNTWEKVIATMFRQAADGDDAARKELFNRSMGKVKEQVELEGKVAFTFVDFVKTIEGETDDAS